VKDLAVVSSGRGAKAEMLLQVMAIQAGDGTASTAAVPDALAGMGFGVMQ
jgi:hypothetical protein